VTIGGGASKSLRLVILVSGRGSNLRALIEAQESGALHSRIVGVFSDRAGCAALTLAREHGLPTFAFKPSDFPSREAFDESMFSRIDQVQPDLIVCAGYLRLISASAVQRFEGRMINIHPSLLPDYPGLDTHSRVLAAGEREHGASVHLVTAELDGGPVLAQARVPVLPDDSAETLAARVLEREHVLLVEIVKAISDARLALGEAQLRWGGAALRAPLVLNAANQLEQDQ
jgi:phosphoribosylglycinamide formyltransferase-1